jgi:hypothetical protein
MIVTSDIEFFLSAPQASAGYTMPGVAGNSLGLYVSTTQLSTAQNGLDNLLLDLPGAQNAANQVDYGCLFIYNSNAVNYMLNPVAWIPTGLLGAQNTASFAIGADPTLPSVLGSSNPQAVAIQSPVIAPTGVTTWAPPSATSAGGVALPNIPPRYVAAVWVRRTANGGAGLNSFTVDVTFNTLA